MPNFAVWKDKALWAACTALVAGGVSWASWCTSQITNRPSRTQVNEMIQTQAPYVQDRKAIEERLNRLDDLGRVIERNTEAINLLRVEIARESND